MKNILILLVILCITCFFGCEKTKDDLNWHDDFFIEGQKAIALTENFCFALSDDDLDAANEYLHPDSPLCNGNLLLFLEEFEQDNSVNFSHGVAFKERGEYSLSPYAHSYKGMAHIFVLETVVSGKKINISFTVVDNEKGFGIYSIEKYNPKKN